MRLKILTEFIFLIPLIIAAWAGLYVYTAIISFSMAGGIAYHLYEEKKFFKLDVALSLLLISFNSYYIYLAKFPFSFFYPACVTLTLSIYFWLKAQKTKYDFNHSMWHVSSVLITIFCILAYVV